MRVTSARLVRSIISKLHPSGVTQQESRNLLRALDTAFNQRLDVSHPKPASSHGKDRGVGGGPPDLTCSTNSHLDLILGHFDSHPHQPKHPVHGVIQGFDQQLSEGALSISTLQYIFGIYLSKIREGPAPADCRLAPRLNAWLVSASPEEQVTFFRADRTVRAAAAVMWRDGADDKLWDWLQILHALKNRKALQGSNQLRWLSIEDNLVASMIRISLNRQDPIGAAQQLVAASARRADLSPDAPLSACWENMLVYIMNTRNRHHLSASIYEQLLYCIPNNIEPRMKCVSLGFMALYSPTNPTTTRLHQELQQHLHGDEWDPSGKMAMHHNQIRRVVNLLDAAELALHQGQVPHVEFFLNFARQKYPDIVPSTESTTEPQTWLQRIKKSIRDDKLRHSDAPHHSALAGG